ncbi:nuclear transport factor 2 family protein [Nocardia sp. alder85J]|uniref:nuclear transport factor 2 family protein n=1 Tax=Nocardia sp. alder85J TaxID=2862949 RepID=UPI001CD5125F|nr:SgcJ/EcaC family oxidoreductase [Nocardia sp. alder85J]MCX4093709.1 SgcJ/EcaC family oxidoreductase [Nocardia sp. alder85J]
MTRTPRELVEQMFHELPARDADAFAALFAPDGVFEIPFPIPGMPTRLVGPDAIRDHLRQRWSGGLATVEVHGIHPQIHETADPEVIVVENEVDMTRPGAGRTRSRTAVNVVRVRDGRVLLFRDYMDTGRFARIAAGD